MEQGQGYVGGGPSVARIVLRFTAAQEAIADMLFSGVFQRYPEFRLVSAESDCGWLPFFMQICDDMYERNRHWAELNFDRTPSQILREQLYCTFMDDAVGCSNLGFTGTNNLMWSSDYPHSVSTWPKSQEYIKKQMAIARVTPSDRAKLLAGNAARLYRLN
jgi:predicted TIM-barrel fold metal-dependent hydrolase